MKALKLGIKRRLLSRSLRLFERKLAGSTVTPQKVEQLFQHLSSISSGYKELQKNYPFTRPDITADLDHIVTLYGRIVSLNQEHEVNAIAKRAHALNERLDKPNCETLAQEVDALKNHIYTFCKDNRPSKEGREILSWARKSAKRAEAILNGQSSSSPSLLEGVAEEVAEDLLEMAFLYNAAQPQEATRLFNALPERVKARCYTHLETIGGNPFDLQGHALKWQQALIRTAFEITDSDHHNRFLGIDEIDAIFQERKALS